MNFTKTVLFGLCLLGLSITGWSQSQNRTSVPGIPGYLDARTGTFRPMPQQIESPDEVPANPITGKFVLNLTVTLQSTFPSTEVYSCGLSTEALDVSTSLFFLDDAEVSAKKSGNTLTCAITLPYSWALTNAGQDMVTITYTVSASNGTAVLPTRLANHGVATIKVPPNGTTTTYTLATVI